MGNTVLDEIKERGWRDATLRAWISPVPWYRSHRSLSDEWDRKNPGKPITFDPRGLVQNLIFKYPGCRAGEGFGQPALGLVGAELVLARRSRTKPRVRRAYVFASCPSGRPRRCTRGRLRGLGHDLQTHKPELIDPVVRSIQK